MKRKAFYLGTALFLTTTALDAWMILNGLPYLGILSVVGTFLVFASAMIWLIYQNDQELHLKRMWLVVPVATFAFAIEKIFTLSGIEIQPTPENLPEVGNLLMARYQMGTWTVSLILLLSFVLAASLMARSKSV